MTDTVRRRLDQVRAQISQARRLPKSQQRNAAMATLREREADLLRKLRGQ